jgi:predicted RNA-binding protein
MDRWIQKSISEMEIFEDWFQDIPNNADFYSHENQQFYVKVLLEYNFAIAKPIIFLPCAKQKPISRSRTHCYLSPITRDDRFEKIIISEPQSVIPYSLEQFCPNYDYPPEALTAKDRWQFVRRLGIFLNKLKETNPKRQNVYHIGGKHHFEILKDAVQINHTFHVIPKIPERGIRDYNESAREFVTIIFEKEMAN